MKQEIITSGLAILVSLLFGACTDLLIVADKADKVFVEKDTASLTIGLEPGDPTIQVTGNLDLPTNIHGTTIVWHSDNSGVVADDGKINRPAFDAGSATVNLEATITTGHETRTKIFTFTVPPLEPTESQAIGADTLALEVSLGGGDLESYVTQDMDLPLTGSWGTTITWASDKPDSISAAGVVACSMVDETVCLTATISRGAGMAETKVFTFVVKATGAALVTIALPEAPSVVELAFRDSSHATITMFTLAKGSSVTVNTSFAGMYAWYVDGSAASLSATSSCTLVGNTYSLGFHTLVIDAVSGGRSYSGQILFKVVNP